MKTYKQYINEGIRDKMTPVSSESITKKLSNLDGSELTKYITDLIFKNDNDVLTLVINSVDMSIVSDYELYDLIFLAISMKNLIGVKLLLDKDLQIEKLHNLYTYALRKDTDIAKFIKQSITMVEGIRDMMTPKNDEDIKKMLKVMTFSKALILLKQQGLKVTDYYSTEHIKNMLNNLSFERTLDLCRQYGLKVTDYFSNDEINYELYLIGINDIDRLSNFISVILQTTKSTYDRSMNKSNIMHELFLINPDYKLDLSIVVKSVQVADARVGFNIQHIYVPLWNSLPKELRKEAIKIYIEKNI